MDNKTPSLATLPSTPSVNPPPKPIDLTTPTPKPTTPTHSTMTPAAAQPEMLAHSPIKQDIAAPSPLPSEQPLPAPVPTSTPEVVSPMPAAPPSAPAPTPPSSIPPLPSLDTIASAAATPVPSATPAPVSDSVINASAPVANSPTPPVGAQATTPTVPTTTGETSSSVAESNTHQPTPQKKSRTLVLIILFLALFDLTLGGLVVWRALQPTTRSIEESMTAPAVPAAQEAEEIIEEEVIVEQPDPTADWEVYANEIFTVKHPTDVISREQQGGVLTLNKTAPGHPDTELIDGLSLTFETHGNTNMTPIEFAQNKIKQSVDNGLGDLISGPEESIFNGYEAATYTFQGLGIYTNIVIKSPRNNSPIIISNGSVDPNNNGYQETVNQILSTFKFSDVSSTPGSVLQGSCTQDGVNYADGEAMPSPDSCNSCSCDNGRIACTAMACEE